MRLIVRSISTSLSVACLMIGGLASAQIININITSGNGNGTTPLNLDGTVAGPAVAPVAYAGTSWNDLMGTPDGMDLVDSEGNATSIDVDWDPAGGNANAFSFSYAAGLDMLNNYFAANNSFGDPVDPSTITFSGLGADTTWDIYFISQGDTAGQGGEFTIGASTMTSVGADPATAGFTEGDNFVKFTGVTADGSGEILTIFDSNPAGAEFQVLNGIQLVASDTEPPLLCDVNGNGVCNSTDFGIIRDALFTQVTPGTGGDLNGDGLVDFVDYRRFKDDPNRVLGVDSLAASATTPEPSGLCWVLMGMLTGASRRIGRVANPVVITPST